MEKVRTSVDEKKVGIRSTTSVKVFKGSLVSICFLNTVIQQSNHKLKSVRSKKQYGCHQNSQKEEPM